MTFEDILTAITLGRRLRDHEGIIGVPIYLDEEDGTVVLLDDNCCRFHANATYLVNA